MAYITPTAHLVSSLQAAVDVMKVDKAAQLMGVTQAQVRSILAGKETYIQPRQVAGAENVGSVLGKRAAGIERHADRLQWLEPKGLPRLSMGGRKTIASEVQYLSDRMDDKRSQFEGFGKKRSEKRQAYMYSLKQLGMNPDDLPSGLRY